MKKKPIILFDSYTPVYYWNRNSTARYVVNQGGTSSSKTYSILQLLARKAIQNKVTITVVASSSRSLERGALRDFKTLINSSKFLRYMLHDSTLVRGPYIFKNGSIIEFVHLKDAETAKHGKRDYLFLNEATSIDYEAALQLMVRTRLQTFIDYNPDAKFWVHREILVKPDAELFISNFTHNQHVPKNVVEILMYYKSQYKALRTNYWKNKWEVYGLGLTGVVEGVIMQHITYVRYLPLAMKRSAYVVDFGFSNSPTAVAKLGIYNSQIYGKELVYQTGLTTPQLMTRLISLGVSKRDLIIADLANPDAIAQMQRRGFYVVPCVKGAGSVKAGLDGLLAYPINLTMDSLNWQREQEKYKWKKIDGKYTNEPVKEYDHLWDCARYWYQHFFPSIHYEKIRHNRKIREFN